MMTCPRRIENGLEDGPFVGAGKNLDDFTSGHGLIGQGRGCSYCGSMNPADFLTALANGAILDVTDKNYKAYVGGTAVGKFYFQHFSVEQRHEFIRMLNAKEVTFGFPGYFAVLPYFIGRQ